jgi:hypothetical protein
VAELLCVVTAITVTREARVDNQFRNPELETSCILTLKPEQGPNIKAAGGQLKGSRRTS